MKSRLTLLFLARQWNLGLTIIERMFYNRSSPQWIFRLLERLKVSRKVICVYIEHFAAAVEIREHQEYLSCPIVVGGLPTERKRVFDCSREAADLGIVPGMPLRQAHHLCPDAAFIPLDEGKYTRAFDEVLDILERFSPAVEAYDLGKAFLDGSGLTGLFGLDENVAQRISSGISRGTHLEPRIGIASSKFVAEMSALAASQQPCVVRQGGEKGFLEPLRANLLPVSEETRRKLDLLGLRTIGQIGSLPQGALVNQFGGEGLLAHQLANGIDDRLLVPREKPIILEDELSSENPFESLESLLSAIDELLDRLIPILKSRNQVCGQLKLCLYLDGASSWNDSFTLKEPTDAKSSIMSFVKHRLQGVQFAAGITGVRLGLTQLGGESGKQESLLQREKLRQNAHLKRASRQLQARLGKNPLKKVVLLDPSSRIPERRSGLTELDL